MQPPNLKRPEVLLLERALLLQGLEAKIPVLEKEPAMSREKRHE
jgi:hypothetical protein